jgi:geranylgeranyl pyrophosphate synthase
MLVFRWSSTKFLDNYLQLLKTTGFEMILPKEVNHSNMGFSSDFDTAAITKSFAIPTYDMLERGGKAWRASSSMMISDMLGLPRDEMLPLAQCVDFIHNATLIHDDLEDKSLKRRGKPCTYLLFGVDRTVNTGSACYFAALSYFYKTSFSKEVKDALIKATIDEMMMIHLGQATDIEWNNSDYIPTQEQYIRMICNKTGVLSRLGVRYPLIVAQSDRHISSAVIEHANNVGISFQIIDDLINLRSEEYAKGRSYVGEDITEGKKTLMVIRAIQQRPEKAERLKEILSMKTNNIELVNEALDIIKSTDAFQYCEDFGFDIIQKSWKKVDEIFPESQAKQDLHDLTFMLSSRKA